MIALSAVADLERLVEDAHASELFSSPHLEDDLARFFAGDAERLRELTRDARDSGVEQVYFVGSGGSWASMYSGKYLCDRLGGPAADVALSYELVWRAPRRLDSKALVFLASYSGATEDTLAALRFARSRGARTVALVNRAETPIGDEADVTIAYGSPGLYCLPMAAVTAFACEWAAADGSREAAEIAERLPGLPALVGRAYRDGRDLGRDRAQTFAESDLVYCVGAGPLYGLAYKFGLTVFMENMRIHSSVIETAEFRHGPAEMLDRQAPDMAVLRRHRRVARDVRARPQARGRARRAHPRLRRRRPRRPAPAARAVRAQGRPAVVRRLLDAHARHPRPRRAGLHGPPGARGGGRDVAVTGPATIGDNCVDRYLPPIGRDLAGGNALNVAAGLVAAGLPTAYVGAIGDDAEGRLIVAEGGAMGIDMRHVVVAPGHTGVTTITVTPDGERIFESEVLGTSGEFRPSAEATAFLATRSWVHATGPGHIVEALEAVAAAGVRVSYDVSQPPRIERFAALGPLLEVAFLSAAGADDPADLAREAIRRGARSAVVGRGKDGCLMLSGGASTSSPPSRPASSTRSARATR